MSANVSRIEDAFKIIEKAKIAGANAIKIQTYKADTITIDSKLPDFQIKMDYGKVKLFLSFMIGLIHPGSGIKTCLHMQKRLAAIFSSPFDSTAIDLLEDLNSPAYKIASFEIVDLLT